MIPHQLLILFYVLAASESASAVNFTQCLIEVQNGTYGPDPGAVDIHGDLVRNESLSMAVGITYELCVRACGKGLQDFDWSLFSQSFCAWLLPWLALTSQLPFGAKHRFDNLLSVLLAVGSPMLAGYSLALTSLNCRHVARRFSGITFPNANEAFRIMSSLQQVSLEIDETLLPSLIVLHENDEWWRDLAERLNYVHRWSVSAATSIAWVFISYLFSVIDSFGSLAGIPDFGSNQASDRQAIGSTRLWLLAIVVGWLQVSPKCDDNAVKAAMVKANTIAFVACHDGPPRKASEVHGTRALSILDDRQGDNEDGARDDEHASPPIYNYARFLPWTQNVEKIVGKFENADFRARKHIRADSSSSETWQKFDGQEGINLLNRIGTIEQLNHYCSAPCSVRRSHWGPDVINRFLVATLAAMLLQWGTSGASVIFQWFTPTQGLGCRSATYISYACLSTLVWLSLVMSSVLVHQSLTLPKGIHRLLVRQLSILLRRTGKVLATMNTLWIVATSMMQLGNAYDTCFCNVQLTMMLAHMWNRAYDIIIVPNVGLTAPWIGGILLGCGCVIVYMLFVNLFINCRP